MEERVMSKSIIGSLAAGLLVASMLVFTGCKGDAPPAENQGAVEAEPTQENAAAAPGAEKPAANATDKDPAPDKDEAAAAASPAATGDKAPTDKATLAKAYVEIYCAQRKKETERLLEIYTRYGFADPKSWTASWTEAAKDDAWVAEITQKAIQTCP